MINTLPLFFRSPGNPIPVNNQAGEISLDQPKTTGNPSNNLFAKIFGDRSAADSSFARQADTTSVVAQPKLSDLESFLDTLNLSGEVQPYPYHVTSLASEGLVPLDASQEGPIVGGFLSPHVFSAGGPRADGIQGTPTGNQPGLPFPTSPSTQPPPVGNSLAEKGAAHVAINVNAQQVLRNVVESPGREHQIESAAEHETIVVKTPVPLQDADRVGLRIPPTSLTTSQEPLKPEANLAFQKPKPFEPTPAGIADVVQSSQNRLKYASGIPSVLSESSVNGKESSIGIPLDLLREGNGSSIGDRSREDLEATGKIGGNDPHGGQGFNSGMGGSTHSQSGFLNQSSLASSSGQGVRMAEERVQDLPGPALQRLQMEVQLSENNRVQIDVGVQHRQVYANLLMDQATLKNLAVQNVPQLEEQLTQGEMELQEFSAEVRDHPGEKESNTQSHGQGTQASQRVTTSLHHTTGALSPVAVPAGDHSLHLVA
ncbi:hypothetical protein [Candidatus Nitrospira allomarina]|uniref:Flagellar hook-length control protein-like C-terminal domain-containing protein n=1 Tax=Candidatus Nitrospira allomarina TaxID=3020900 RepID=A0AA96G8L0_9BACT|nr:hypothetical protein [Candidatus Nitrospira allomarina]WNM56762.1 hypothetical protein PP769_12325 [Candidatus Nitrospira allomarina]